MRTLIALASLLVLSGCLSNNFAGKAVARRLNTLSGLSSSTSSDSASGQCTGFDVGNPTRAICIDCYSSILSSRCPGKTTPSSCADPIVVRDFTKLVNTCISNSTIAGFICAKTCPSTLVLNASTCSCQAPTSSGSGSSTGGTGTVDSGQFDYGPPVVTLRPSNLTSVTTTASGGAAITSCAMSFTGAPHGLIIRNRGGSAFRNNTYAPPTNIAATVNGDGVTTYLSNVGNITPVANQSFINATIGFSVTGAGHNELAGSTNLPAGSITLSGSSQTLTGPGINAPATGTAWSSTLTDDGVGFGARDKFGNVYFIDPTAFEIKVICNAATGIANHKCELASSVGTVQRVTTTTAAAKGIAVDRFSNVYFSRATAEVYIFCHQSGYYCTAGDVMGAVPVTLSSKHADFSALVGEVHGFDLLTDSTESALAVIYSDATNSNVYAACNFVDAAGPCTGAGMNTLITNADVISGSTLSGPRSVAIHPTTQSVYVSDTGRHRIVARCYNADASGVDPCSTTAAGTNVVIAGTGTAGDSGDGAAASSALITSPAQLTFTKVSSEDNGDAAIFVTPFPNYRDNNLVFAESYRAATSTSSASGATVRIICGTNTGLQPGFCTNITAGYIQTLAGAPGARGSSSNNSTALRAASSVLFSNPTGVTYDKFKNLAVSSTKDSTSTVADNSIRSIRLNAISSRLAMKYSVLDTNNLTSYWCMRFHLMTSCSASACSCSLVAPLDGSLDTFTGQSSTDSCN